MYNFTGLMHCEHLKWFAFLGLLLFYIGMAINVHSDYILHNLRRPGDEVYKNSMGKKERSHLIE